MVKTLTRIANNRTMIVRQGTGSGVIAMTTIQAGEVIERAPVIIVENEMVPAIGWDNGSMALPLGHCALANVSKTPNAALAKHIEEKFVDFTALRVIKPGEEITVGV